MTDAPNSTQGLVLASTSPRRRELLAGLGLSFTVVPSDFDEDAYIRANPLIEPQQLVIEMAMGKASEVARRLSKDAVVIGADTVVVIDGHVLGKPVDEADAKRMLRRLSGRVHTVYSGIAVVVRVSPENRDAMTDVVATNVKFHELTDDQIDLYVATGEPMDKAGSYGIQEHGRNLVERIEGDYHNVVGLSLEAVRRLLGTVGIQC